MVSLVFSSPDALFYLDGLYKGKKTFTSYTFNQGLCVGAIGYGDTTYNWNGMIDEFRVSTVARSSNWLWACAMGVASNTSFQTYGPVFQSAASRGTMLLIR